MSIRAHRVVRIQYAEYDSFNLSHDERFLKALLDHPGTNDLRAEGGGIIEVPIEALKAAMPLLSEEDRLYIQRDIEWAHGTHNNMISYDCF